MHTSPHPSARTHALRGHQGLSLTGLRFVASLGILDHEKSAPQPIQVDAELETLIGKLCARLLHLPGVQGVRVKITKLEIFDDCEVAIRMEAGRW